MAEMSIADRTKVWRGLMRRWSNDRSECGITKYQLYNPADNTGVIAEVDAWVDTHQGNTTADNVGMNGAINLTARGILSVDQKSDVMIAVIAMRRGIEYLRSVFGEVD